MSKYLHFGLFYLGLTFNPLQAAEISTCIIDTSIKSNKVFYYFPLSSTLLQCDHLSGNTPVSLREMYTLNWRLIHIVSPVQVDQGKTKAAYTPPVLYLERTSAPQTSAVENQPASTDSTDDNTETDAADTTESSGGGGLFNWLGGDSAEQ